MNRDDNSFAVSMTRCFYCGEPFEILMNRILTPFHAMEVKALDGKVITKEPCQKCKEWMAQGIMFISVRDGEKSDNPYRTGKISVIRDEAVKRFLKGDLLEQVLTHRMAFIEDTVWDAIGLPNENIDNRDEK